MELPHRRYVAYLIARRLRPMEISADCAARGLMSPDVAYVQEIAATLGKLPKAMSLPLKEEQVEAWRWLRDNGLLPLWTQTPEVRAAFGLLEDLRLREATEMLLLGEAKEGAKMLQSVRKQLHVRFGDNAPTIDTLRAYYDIFFNLGEMTQLGRWEFLERSYDDQQRHAIATAADQGDMAGVYAHLGLMENLSEQQVLERIVRFNLDQMEKAARLPGMLSGTAMAGIGTLQRTTMDAAERLSDLRERSTPLGSAQEDAKQWKIGYRPPKRIRTIAEAEGESLVANVIDAEFTHASEDSGHGQAARGPAVTGGRRSRA